MDVLNALFRWLHILAGIGWIGILVVFWIFPRIFEPIFWSVVHLLYPEVRYG